MLLTLALVLLRVTAVGWFVVAWAYLRARDRAWRTRIVQPGYQRYTEPHLIAAARCSAPGTLGSGRVGPGVSPGV